MIEVWVVLSGGVRFQAQVDAPTRQEAIAKARIAFRFLDVVEVI